MSLTKIVSGGQTGIDRGALDAALAAGFPCGGWCPAGRKAEDGVIPANYPLREFPRAGYPPRTRQNVLDSDGTLVIHFGKLAGGTLKTVQLCKQHGKPVLVLDGLELDPEQTAESAAAFVTTHAIRVLNVAGPRESGYPGARAFAEYVVSRLISIAANRYPQSELP